MMVLRIVKTEENLRQTASMPWWWARDSWLVIVQRDLSQRRNPVRPPLGNVSAALVRRMGVLGV